MWASRRGGMAAYVSDRDLDLGAGGTFAFVLATEEPTAAELAGDAWVPIPEDSSGIVVREYIADRDHETGAELSIEPLDPPGTPGPPDDTTLAEQLTGMAWTMAKLTTLHRTIRPELMESPNVLVTAEAAELGAADTTPDNLYMMGTFRLEPDEALVIDARAAGHPLLECDPGEHLARVHRPPPPPPVTSPTPASSREADGGVRIVVAASDPGVGALAGHRRPAPGIRRASAGWTTPTPPPHTTAVVRPGRAVPLMEPDRLDRSALVEEATARTGEDDFGEPTWEEGLDILLDSLREEARLNDLGVEVAATERGGLPGQPPGPHGLAPGPSRGGRRCDRTAHRHRGPAPDRHHHPVRRAGPGPGVAGPADLGGRPPRPTARAGRPATPTPASPRSRPPSTWPSPSCRDSPPSTPWGPASGRSASGSRRATSAA